MNQELLALMSERTDGDWELLATAAGESFSVERTIAALLGPGLTSGGFMSGAPTRRRVEALAAFDILALLELARVWPRLGHAGSNGSGVSPALMEAWAAALRHLPLEMQRDLLQGDIPGSWEEEKVALMSPAPRFQTWEELVHFAEGAGSYAELRATDRAFFPTAPATERCIDALLEVAPRERWGRFQTLRVLRAATGRLSDGARAFLLDLAQASWGEFSGDHPAQLLLYELASAIDPDAEVMELAAEHLRTSLKAASGPLHLLQTAYAVAGTGWMMP